MRLIILFAFFAISCSTLRDPKTGEALGEKGGGVFGAVVGDAAGNEVAGNMIGISLGGATGEALTKTFDNEAKLISEKLPNARMTRTKDSITLNVPGADLFRNSRSTISSTGSQMLEELAGILNNHASNKVKIRSYTTVRVQPLLLTRKRAAAILNRLKTKGIAADRLTAVGMGRPVSHTENTPEIVFVIER